MPVPNGFRALGPGSADGTATTWRARSGRRRVIVTLGADSLGEAAAEALAVRMALAQRRSLHPLLADVTGFGFTCENRPWLAVQDGRRPAPMPLQDALRTVLRVADALAALHDAGTVHGAVSPGAIVLTKVGALLHPLPLGGGPTPPEGGRPTVAGDVWALASTFVTLHPAAAGLAGVREALSEQPQARPATVRELAEVLAWVERTEGFAPTAPTGVTLRPVSDPVLDVAALGWARRVELVDTDPGEPRRQRLTAVPRPVLAVAAAAVLVATGGVVAVATPATHRSPPPVTRADRATADVLVAGATTASGQQVGSGGTLRVPLVGDITADPVQVQPGDDEILTRALFAPLVNLDDAGQPQDDGSAAASATPTDGCLTWTFALKPGTFSNGDVVDATSYVRGWSRAARLTTHSPTAALMGGIAGYDSLQSGDATSFAGVVAADPGTLVVHLTAPDCAFDIRASAPVFSPYDGLVAAPDDEHPVGDGPFQLTGDGYDLVRYDGYSFGAAAHLAAVQVVRVPDADAAWQAFTSGAVDVADVPTGDLAAARATYPAGFLAQSDASVVYLAAVSADRPLDQLLAREAVSAAIDRTALVAGPLGGSALPATGVVPPVFPAVYQPGVCATCTHPDPALARSLAQRAGLTPGTRVTLVVGGEGSGAGIDTLASTLAQQLETVLGITVAVETLAADKLDTTLRSPAADALFLGHHAATLPLPETVLAPLVSSAAISTGPDGTVDGSNTARFSDPAVDRLLSALAISVGAGTRASNLKAVEQQAIGVDLAVVPLYFPERFRVFGPAFTDVHLDLAGNPDLRAVHLR